MKAVIFFLILITASLIVAHIKDWVHSIAFFLLVLSYVLGCAFHYTLGYKEAVDDTMKDLEAFKKKIENDGIGQK